MYSERLHGIREAVAKQARMCSGSGLPMLEPVQAIIRGEADQLYISGPP